MNMMKFRIVLFVVAICIGYGLYDDFDPNILKGKNVVITGASTGIGEQMAYHYAKMGARILITSRTESSLKQVIERCRELGHPDGQYIYLATDMTDMAATKTLIEFAKSQLGGIDYLVLNHMTVNVLGPWLGAPENLTVLQRTMDVNFMAYAHLASHALPLLEKSHGSIVVVSSAAGRISLPYGISYSSSKFALEGFFSGLRQELRIREVDVSVTICIIGFVDTKSNIASIQNFGSRRMQSLMNIMERADNVGYAIIKGGAQRIREVYFPYTSVWLSTRMHNLMPTLMETISQYFYKID